MSLRWFARADLYRCRDAKIRILLEKIPGVGVRVSAESLEPKIFEQMTSAEMFISRFKKDLKLKVDCLVERTYYFGRQNIHYDKEVE